MSVLRRQRQQVSMRLSSPSVEDAVATVRARRDQARKQHVRVKVEDDGKFAAWIPGDRSSSPPRLSGRFEPGDGDVVFEGVISESHASLAIPRGFTGMAAILAAVTVLLAVEGDPSPGSYVCGVSGLLFGLIGYVLSRLRGSSFTYDCTQLLSKLTPLMPGARPPDEDSAGIRHRLP